MSKQDKIDDLYNIIAELEERVASLEEGPTAEDLEGTLEERMENLEAHLDHLDEWADDTTEMVMHLIDRDDEVEEELAVHDFRLDDLEELHEHILFPGDE